MKELQHLQAHDFHKDDAHAQPAQERSSSSQNIDLAAEILSQVSRSQTPLQAQLAALQESDPVAFQYVLRSIAQTQGNAFVNDLLAKLSPPAQRKAGAENPVAAGHKNFQSRSASAQAFSDAFNGSPKTQAATQKPTLGQVIAETPSSTLPMLAEMEERFCKSLSHIQVHTGPLVEAFLKDHGAAGAAICQHILLKAGATQHTIAEEVAHCEQQGGQLTEEALATLDNVAVSQPNDASEREAGGVADQFVSDQPIKAVQERRGPHLARQLEGEQATSAPPVNRLDKDNKFSDHGDIIEDKSTETHTSNQENQITITIPLDETKSDLVYTFTLNAEMQAIQESNPKFIQNALLQTLADTDAYSSEPLMFLQGKQFSDTIKEDFKNWEGGETLRLSKLQSLLNERRNVRQNTPHFEAFIKWISQETNLRVADINWVISLEELLGQPRLSLGEQENWTVIDLSAHHRRSYAIESMINEAIKFPTPIGSQIIDAPDLDMFIHQFLTTHRPIEAELVLHGEAHLPVWLEIISQNQYIPNEFDPEKFKPDAQISPDIQILAQAKIDSLMSQIDERIPQMIVEAWLKSGKTPEVFLSSNTSEDVINLIKSTLFSDFIKEINVDKELRELIRTASHQQASYEIIKGFLLYASATQSFDKGLYNELTQEDAILKNYASGSIERLIIEDPVNYVRSSKLQAEAFNNFFTELMLCKNEQIDSVIVAFAEQRLTDLEITEEKWNESLAWAKLPLAELITKYMDKNFSEQVERIRQAVEDKQINFDDARIAEIVNHAHQQGMTWAERQWDGFWTVVKSETVGNVAVFRDKLFELMDFDLGAIAEAEVEKIQRMYQRITQIKDLDDVAEVLKDVALGMIDNQFEKIEFIVDEIIGAISDLEVALEKAAQQIMDGEYGATIGTATVEVGKQFLMRRVQTAFKGAKLQILNSKNKKKKEKKKGENEPSDTRSETAKDAANAAWLVAKRYTKPEVRTKSQVEDQVKDAGKPYPKDVKVKITVEEDVTAKTWHLKAEVTQKDHMGHKTSVTGKGWLAEDKAKYFYLSESPESEYPKIVKDAQDRINTEAEKIAKDEPDINVIFEHLKGKIKIIEAKPNPALPGGLNFNIEEQNLKETSTRKNRKLKYKWTVTPNTSEGWVEITIDGKDINDLAIEKAEAIVDKNLSVEIASEAVGIGVKGLNLQENEIIRRALMAAIKTILKSDTWYGQEAHMDPYKDTLPVFLTKDYASENGYSHFCTGRYNAKPSMLDAYREGFVQYFSEKEAQKRNSHLEGQKKRVPGLGDVLKDLYQSVTAESIISGQLGQHLKNEFDDLCEERNVTNNEQKREIREFMMEAAKERISGKLVNLHEDILKKIQVMPEIKNAYNDIGIEIWKDACRDFCDEVMAPLNVRHILVDRVAKVVKHKYKHLQSGDKNALIKISETGNSQYFPQEKYDFLVKDTMKKGDWDRDEGNIIHSFKIYDEVIGFDRGQPTKRHRAEITTGHEMHGHPRETD